MRGWALFATMGAAAAVAACTLLVGTDDLTEEPDAGDASTPPPPDAPVESATVDGAIDTGTTDAGTDARSYRDEVLADSPVLYLRLGETNGPEAKDEVGASSTYLGDVGYGAPGAVDGSTGVRLDGGSGAVIVGQRFHFEGRAPFSLEGWLNPDSYDGAFRGLVSHYAVVDGGRESYGIWVQATNGVSFERYVNADVEVAQIKVSLPAVGIYHHLVGVYDGNELRLYIDGVLVNTAADTRSAPPTPGGTVYVGRLNPGLLPIVGAIDEVAIYDKALGGERIRAHFDAAKR